MEERYGFLKKYGKIRYNEKNNTLNISPSSRLWSLIGIIIGIVGAVTTVLGIILSMNL